MDETNNTDLKAWTTIVEALKTLDAEAQKRTLHSIATFLGISGFTEFKSPQTSQVSQLGVSFSENRDVSPKQFMREKAPKTDGERIACLGYYLTHYKDTPHFKTIDLSTLNTEAAQPKFSNAAVAVNNALRDGLLVQASKGAKQISSAGEIFVQTLPDHAAAKASLANVRVRKRNKKSSSKNFSKE